nr:hypothetical protein [Burkholderiales bacterium]
MKQRNFIRYWAALAAFFALLLIIPYALAGTVTAATGGAAISADTALPAVCPTCTWTSLTGPSYQETINGDLGNGTVILTAPAGFQFNTTAVVSVVLVTGDANAVKNMNNIVVGGNVATTTNGTLTVTATTITFTITSKSQGSVLNRIQWQGIQVRPTAGFPLASGNIVPSGTSLIATAANTTNFGTLTEVAGAMTKLLTVMPGQGFTAGTGVTGTATAQTAGTAFNITQLVAADQFNNVVTTYTGAKTISYSGPATACATAPSYTTAVNFSNGISTTTLATTLRKVETTTITASDASAAVSGPASSSFAVNVGALSKLVVTLPGETFSPCAGNTGTVTNQTTGVAFNIVSITATDANFNIITSYSGAKTLSYSGPSGSPSYTTAVNFTSGQATTALATTLTVGETTTITVSDGVTTGPASSSLTVTSSVSSFNAFETTTAAGATSGVLKTKISGTAFGFAIVALTSTPTVSSGFTGTVKVEFLDASGAGTCTTWPVIQTLANQSFDSTDNGRHTVTSTTEPNAWKNVTVRISYPVASPTIISCSIDH